MKNLNKEEKKFIAYANSRKHLWPKTQFQLYNCHTKKFDLCEIGCDDKVVITERGVSKL